MEKFTESERLLWLKVFGTDVPQIECSPKSQDGKSVTVTITKACYASTSKLLALGKIMEDNQN